MAGVLVWADPISDQGDRRLLDRVLREVATSGVNRPGFSGGSVLPA
jgi:hypothetical protein